MYPFVSDVGVLTALARDLKVTSHVCVVADVPLPASHAGRIGLYGRRRAAAAVRGRGGVCVCTDVLCLLFAH
jgi:hypothetical protein